MKSKLLIGAAAAIAVGVFAVALLEQPTVSYTAPAAVSENVSAQPQQPTQTQPAGASGLGDASAPAKPARSGYTMAQVAAHDSASSCWTAINGNVYDVTSWINQHPGGRAAILSLCGTDGSAAFNGQHGGQGRPEAELATFYIGKLSS